MGFCGMFAPFLDFAITLCHAAVWIDRKSNEPLHVLPYRSTGSNCQCLREAKRPLHAKCREAHFQACMGGVLPMEDGRISPRPLGEVPSPVVLQPFGRSQNLDLAVFSHHLWEKQCNVAVCNVPVAIPLASPLRLQTMTAEPAEGSNLHPPLPHHQRHVLFAISGTHVKRWLSIFRSDALGSIINGDIGKRLCPASFTVSL